MVLRAHEAQYIQFCFVRSIAATSSFIRRHLSWDKVRTEPNRNYYWNTILTFKAWPVLRLLVFLLLLRFLISKSLRLRRPEPWLRRIEFQFRQLCGTRFQSTRPLSLSLYSIFSSLFLRASNGIWKGDSLMAWLRNQLEIFAFVLDTISELIFGFGCCFVSLFRTNLTVY